MQGISNYPCRKAFEYHRLSFAFIFTLPQYLMKICICFDTYLGTCPTVFPILSLQAVACLSCTRVDDSSSLLAFLISPSLGCQSLEKSGTHERKIGFFFCNNQQKFFIDVSYNHFNRPKHFVCFVSCIYHCMLLIKVCVYVAL